MSYTNHARNFEYSVPTLILRNQNVDIVLPRLSREARHFFHATSSSIENNSFNCNIIQHLV